MPVVAGPTEIPFTTFPSICGFDSGPWPNGGGSAIVGMFVADAAHSEQANSSTIQGTSWTDNYLAFGEASYRWYDPGSNDIYSLSVASSGSSAAVEISNANTSSTTSIAGPSGLSNLLAGSGLVALLPNGAVAIVLWSKVGSQSFANFYRYTGSWSSGIQLTDIGTVSGGSPEFFPLEIVVDSNNVCYIVYNIASGSNTLVKVQTVDASGNLGPVCTVINSASANSFQSNFGRRAMLFNSQLWVAVVDPVAAAVSVYRSGSLTNLVYPANTPVTFTLSYSTPAPSQVVYGGPNLAGTSTMYVVWNAQTVTSPGNVTHDQMIATAYSGSGDTWGTAQVGLDWVNTPPAPPLLQYPAQASHFWSTHVMADGTFGTFCDFNDNTFCYAFYTNWTFGLTVTCGS